MYNLSSVKILNIKTYFMKPLQKILFRFINNKIYLYIVTKERNGLMR